MGKAEIVEREVWSIPFFRLEYHEDFGRRVGVLYVSHGRVL